MWKQMPQQQQKTFATAQIDILPSSTSGIGHVVIRDPDTATNISNANLTTYLNVDQSATPGIQRTKEAVASCARRGGSEGTKGCLLTFWGTGATTPKIFGINATTAGVFSVVGT